MIILYECRNCGEAKPENEITEVIDHGGRYDEYGDPQYWWVRNYYGIEYVCHDCTPKERR